MRSIVKIYEKKKLIKFIIILVKQLENGFRALWLSLMSSDIHLRATPNSRKLRTQWLFSVSVVSGGYLQRYITAR